MQLDPKKLPPMPGYVLVEPAEKATQTAGGIYLPDNASDKPQAGTVLAVGADWNTEHGATLKSPVKIGDKVVYKKWGGNEIKVGHEEWLLVEQKDIMAVIRP